MDLYCFDFRGAYLGRLDDGGLFFDSHGRQQGRVGDRGGFYDLAGHYLGRIDAQGSLFAADGTCRGYVRNWTTQFRHQLPCGSDNTEPPNAGPVLLGAC